MGIILTGDFNARSSYFWESDADTRDGQILSGMSISNNLDELICKPTHIRDDGSQSCIDLIFTDQKYAFTDVQVTLHSEKQSKHLVVYGKITFSIYSPPPYKRKISDYDHANHTKTSEDLNSIDWENSFSNKDIKEMTNFFSEIFMLIMSQIYPIGLLLAMTRMLLGLPLKLNPLFKGILGHYRKWVLKGRIPNDKDNIRSVQNETNRLIRKAKKDYFNNLGSKLNDYSTGQLLNVLWIGRNYRIYLLFRKMGRLFLIFTIFNDYFAMRCTLNVTSRLKFQILFLSDCFFMIVPKPEFRYGWMDR